MTDDQPQLNFGGPHPGSNGTQETTPGDNGDPHEDHIQEGWTLYGRIEGPLKRLIDDNFLQYASYVIRDRAIPDLDDGLKPVQRRILYSLHENDDGKFIKVANIAGYCMQYHPHGNVSIEDALTTLANKRYLIEGQGNFGNLYTGDPPSASRYIECRLTELARTQLFNDKLTRFVPSYDGRRNEPVTLPAKLPLLLMLGAEGIAVGLSTRIFPHNFGELLEAQIAILQKKPFKIFPDFQQGGLMDPSEYDKGNGKIKIRAVIDYRKSENTLVVKELPYGTTTDTLISSIEDAARKKKIKIRSIHDFTAEQVEIAVQLVAGEEPSKTMKALFAFTNCEMSLSSRLVLIHENRPVEMDVDGVLRHNTRRLVQILKKELQLKQKHLFDELHFKTLAQLFVEHRIYKRIEDCETYRAVQAAVLDGVNQFREQLRRDVTLQDVEKLLAIQIKRISLFDIQKNRKEIGDIIRDLDDVEKHLGQIIPYSIKYLKALHRKYAKEFPRRTRLKTFEQVERRALVRNEYSLSWDQVKHYVGHGVNGEDVFECSSYDRILLVWRDGRYKVIPPPEKLFVDDSLIHCGKFDRDTEYVMVFSHHDMTYMKRFTLGGVILNKEYNCTLPEAKILLFAVGQPKEIFVKYAPAKGQRIHQQVFLTKNVPLKGVKARGSQITVKKIRSLSAQKPKNWNHKKSGPRGVALHH